MIDLQLDTIMNTPGGLQQQIQRMIHEELGIPEHHELLGTKKVAQTEAAKALREIIKGALLQQETKEQEAESDDNALPIKKAAQILNLARQTVYGMTSRREIPFYKKGKRLYFKKSELLEWIEEGRKKSKAEIKKDAEIYFSNKK